MTEALYLVTKNVKDGQRTVDGIFAAVINADDGGSDATILAAADAQMVAKGHPLGQPTYFDTVVGKISDLSSGVLKDNNDCYLFMGGPINQIQKAEG